MEKEQTDAWRRILIFATLGIVVGVIVLHPAAMFISDYHGMTSHLNWAALQTAFSPHHMPMSLFFGTLGVFIGALYGLLDVKLARHVRRIQLLEGMLPICCVCKRIRSESSLDHAPPRWVQIEEYISSKSDATFTHGYCPDCEKGMLQQIKERSEKKQ